MSEYNLILEIEDLSYYTEIHDEDYNPTGYSKEELFKIVEENYEIVHDGRLFINPKYGLNNPNYPLPSQRTREERYRKDDFRRCEDDEILQIKKEGMTQFCKNYNDKELKKIIAERQLYEEKLRTLPESKDIQKRISSLNEIIGKFLIWYETHNFNTPIFLEKIKTFAAPIIDESEIIISDKIDNSDNNKKNSSQYVSVVDKKYEIISRAAEFINEKIKRLPNNYTKAKVGRLVGEAWQNIALINIEDFDFQAKEFCNLVYVKIKSKFDWNQENFYNNVNTYVNKPTKRKKSHDLKKDR